MLATVRATRFLIRLLRTDGPEGISEIPRAELPARAPSVGRKVWLRGLMTGAVSLRAPRECNPDGGDLLPVE